MAGSRKDDDFRRPIPSELQYLAEREINKRMDQSVKPLPAGMADRLGGVPNGIGRRN
jgi:hypothetical protein